MVEDLFLFRIVALDVAHNKFTGLKKYNTVMELVTFNVNPANFL